MNEHIAYENIFTPQGLLGEVSKNPNLDFLMNICNIPRVYSVSGFGTWNAAQHTLPAAFLALYWSPFRPYPQENPVLLGPLPLSLEPNEAWGGTISPFSRTLAVSEP